METEQILTFVIGLIGFLLTIILTAGALFLLRKPLSKAILYLFEDEALAKYGSLVIMVFLGLVGLVGAFGAFYPDSHGFVLYLNRQFQFGELIRYALTGLRDLAQGFADVVRWAIYIGALLFIGYAIKGWKKSGK